MGSAAAASSTERLLERHRPLLRYDRNERHHAQPVAPPFDAPRERRGDRVYGHLAREDGRRWLQYWLFYPYNSQDRGIVRTGRHEGDWEFVQLRLDDGGRPDVATFAQHSWAEGCRFAELERVRGAPVVYVANGSHASYARAGTTDRPFPDPNDEADGRGRRVRPTVERIDDQHPAWVRWPGRWGQSRASPVPGEQSSPAGPRFQEDGRWRRPASYHREHARACGSGAPGRPWQTVRLAGVGLLLLVGSLRVVGRRRRRSDPGG